MKVGADTGAHLVKTRCDPVSPSKTSGLPAAPITETGASLAATGLTYTDNANGTATIAGTALAGTSGTYGLTLGVNNGIGADTQMFTLTIV